MTPETSNPLKGTEFIPNLLRSIKKLIRSTTNEFGRYSQAIDLRERVKNLFILWLNSDLDEEKEKSVDYAKRFNEVTSQHNCQLTRVNTLKGEKEDHEGRIFELEKVICP